MVGTAMSDNEALRNIVWQYVPDPRYVEEMVYDLTCLTSLSPALPEVVGVRERLATVVENQFGDAVTARAIRGHIPYTMITVEMVLAALRPDDARGEKPTNCRNRLRDEGKLYPRSGCAHCKDGGMRGCPFERSTLAPDEAPKAKDSGEMREQGQAEGFAAAVQQLRDYSAQKPPATPWYAASILADQLEQSRIPSRVLGKEDGGE